MMTWEKEALSKFNGLKTNCSELIQQLAEYIATRRASQVVEMDDLDTVLLFLEKTRQS